MRTILCSTLALAVFALTLGADTAPKKVEPVVVPFELLASGHMAVKVKANGKGPFLLIFDTGAPMSLVNNRLAKEADLLKGVPKPDIYVIAIILVGYRHNIGLFVFYTGKPAN